MTSKGQMRRLTGRREGRTTSGALPPPYKETYKPDVIIGNPSCYPAYHLAEWLGVPFVSSFTMPWTPAKEFCMPLVSQFGSEKPGRWNRMTFSMVDNVMWLGLADLVNAWRVKHLCLPSISSLGAPLSAMYSGAHGPHINRDKRVPALYCYSQALQRDPEEWPEASLRAVGRHHAFALDPWDLRSA